MAIKMKDELERDYSAGADASIMSDEDYADAKYYGDHFNAAEKEGNQAGMQAAHDAVEAIRAKYSYSGGDDGSQYIKLPQDLSARDFSYESAPAYVSKYQSQIDELASQIMDREKFSYDPAKDPLYQQYADSYTRNGQRAMQDTLGQLSARTGGLASSYAGTASQQTYDNYMAALADKVPELYQLAYSMYRDEGSDQRANLEMLMALEQGDYAKYADLLSQWNTDRSFDYGVYRNNISDQRYDTEWDYQVGRDQIADQRYEDETEWERSQYASETEYNQALAKAQTLAAAGDFSGYKALGYTDAEIANLKTAYDKAQAASGNGGATSGGGGTTKPTLTAAQALSALQSGIVNDTTKAAFEYYYGQPWEDAGYTDDATISNRHGDSWIYIPGHGRFSYPEVEQYVNSGQVIETYDPATNTYSYKWNNSYNQ